MANNSDIDRLSALPDSILTCNIFSHLSLRDVVRTSLLSTRWKSLWKQIAHLDFSKEFFQSMKSLENWRWQINPPKEEVKCLNDIIDNILLLHSGHIEGFSIDLTDFIFAPEGLGVERWIHHAAQKEVKHMSLKTSSKIDIPPSLFACHLLMDLELENFKFTGIPTDFDGFRYLQSCSLSGLEGLTDDGLQQLVGLCPLLHTLVLYGCCSLHNLNIQAPNLNSLKIGYYCFRLYNLDIQAPNLNSLKLESCLDLKSLTIGCPQLVELAIEGCLSLIEFKMNSCVLFHDRHMSDVRLPKEHPRLNSLGKLSVKACKVSDLTLLNILGCFRNLEEVHIQIFEDEYWEGEVEADSTFPSLKKLYVDISSAMKKEEVIMLAFLLNNAPSLNTITLTLPYCPANIHAMEFINKVVDLQQIYEKVDIRTDTDYHRFHSTCDTDDEYGDRSE